MGGNALSELELQRLYEAKEEHIIKLHRRATDSYRVEGPRRKLLWAMYREATDRFAVWKEENGFKTIPPLEAEHVADEFADMDKDEYDNWCNEHPLEQEGDELCLDELGFTVTPTSTTETSVSSSVNPV